MESLMLTSVTLDQGPSVKLPLKPMGIAGSNSIKAIWCRMQFKLDNAALLPSQGKRKCTAFRYYPCITKVAELAIFHAIFKTSDTVIASTVMPFKNLYQSKLHLLKNLVSSSSRACIPDLLWRVSHGSRCVWFVVIVDLILPPLC